VRPSLQVRRSLLHAIKHICCLVKLRYDFRYGCLFSTANQLPLSSGSLCTLALHQPFPQLLRATINPLPRRYATLRFSKLTITIASQGEVTLSQTIKVFHLKLPDTQVCCITLGTDPTRIMEAHTNGPRKNTTWTCPFIQMYLVHFLPLSGNHRQTIQLNQDQASLKTTSASPLVTQNGPTGIQTNVLARAPRLGHLCVSR
jgi:hypothetical protein